MTRRNLVLAILVGLTPHLAVAQTAPAPSPATFGVGASTPQWCAITNAGQQPVNNGPTLNTTGPIGADVRIVDLVDPTTLSTRAATTSIGFEAACNYPHRVTIRSQNNALRRAGGNSAQGVASAVPYSASLNWGDVNLDFFADAQNRAEVTRVGATTNAVAGVLTVQVNIAAGATDLGPNSPLGAGEYSDVISIEMGPL